MTDLSQRLANLSPQQWKLLQQRLQGRGAAPEPIAIVGMGCRFPGAPDLEAYWRLIEQGIDATAEIPPDRWDVEALYDPSGEQPGKMSVRRAGLIENIDQFDPQFFGISPREAARMDPQQRLLLEVCWEALETGGIAAESLAGSPAGVFVGIGGTDYAKVPAQFDGYYQHIDAHVGTGNALSIAANRVSYIFDLRGPSLAVDTACSSSTMAIHLAVQSLRRRECSLALSGGVNAILTPETTIAFSKARMLSPDGVCRPFDAGANGYVRGEGCGILVLKRLADAQRDGDSIYAVIRGTGTNQDGRTSGITAPNAVSQQAVILAALAQAGLQPDAVSYVEAHGTGTPLGDPIEIEALRQVFRRRAADAPPCYVTSVKANVGHMETVSGVAGIIKVALMMQHQTIPAQLHLKQLNPRISLDQSRLVIPTQAVPWPLTQASAIAGVSSFGFGGANTHVVLQSPPIAANDDPSAAPESPPTDRSRHLVTLSAKSAAALRASAERLSQWLEQSPEAALADVASTLNRGRSHLPHRAALVAADAAALRQQLSQLAAGKTPRGAKLGTARSGQRPEVAFLFTGQGAQYVGMGRGLYETQPQFRQTLQRCEEILRDLLPCPLLSILYPDPQAAPPAAAESPIDQTRYTQPALFAVEYALAALWRSWGIEPAAVLGHSVGEYVAACVAGIVSLEDALRLIAQRGRLMQALPSGGQMAAVFASADRVSELIEATGGHQELSLAATNGPENTVVSGAAAAMDRLVARCEQAGLTVQRLRVSHAFHSSLMEPMLPQFHALAAACTFHPPQVPLVSNVTGEVLQGTWDADYLCQHVRGTVRFAESMATLSGLSPDVYLEAGPAPVLIGMGRRCLSDSPALWLPSLRQGQHDEETLLASVAELEVAGAPLDWHAFDQPWPRLRLRLPTYPFERQRCWFDPTTATPRGMRQEAPQDESLHPLLGRRVPAALNQQLFQQRLGASAPAYLAEHCVQDSVAFPAAGYIELTLAAAEQLLGPGAHRVEDLLLQQAMFLPPRGDRQVQTIVAAESGGSRAVQIASAAAEPEGETSWTLHAYGKLRASGDVDSAARRAPAAYPTVGERVVNVQTQEQFYQTMADRKLQYGPRFRVLGKLSRTPDEAWGEVQLEPAVTAELSAYRLHPALGDALLQTCAGWVPAERDGSYSPFTYMPTRIGSAQVFGQPSGPLWTYGRRHEAEAPPSPETVTGDVWLINGAGEVVAEFLSVQLTRVGQLGDAAAAPLAEAVYQTVWQAAESPAPVAAAGQAADDGAAEPFAGRSWLLFADATGVAAGLARRLAQAGGSPILVYPSQAAEESSPEESSPGRSTLSGGDPRQHPPHRDTHAANGDGHVLNGDTQVANRDNHTLNGDNHADDGDSHAGNGDRHAENGDGQVLSVALGDPAAYRQLFAAVQHPGRPPLAGAVHLWGLDDAGDPAGEAAIDRGLNLGGRQVLELIQQLIRQAAGQSDFQASWQGLYLVTAGAQRASETQRTIRFGQAPLWGLGRVAAVEHPELRCRLVDLDPQATPAQSADALWQELQLAALDREDQIAYRDQQRRVARLQRARLPLAPSGSAAAPGGKVELPSGPFRLRFAAPGSFDSLYFESCGRTAPQGEEVELRVTAAGLNFSDVLKAMGLYPGITDPVVPLGIECAGVVTAVGPDVTRFQVGDPVYGVAPFAFGSHARTAQFALAKRPAGIEDAAAATIPIAFLTAYYALVQLADLQPGERVLIHAGAGGVGLAAIQIAQHRGAEIFATAGSEEKREHLRSLGVQHVFSSRTLDFAEEILAVTDRQGVDVVLNSLPGDVIPKSLAILRAYGRFLEIGKTEIYQNRLLGLAPFQDNLSYFAIDLDRILRQRPQVIQRLFASLQQHFAAGDFQPLAATAFAATEVADAFRYMAQRKNIGKVVVHLPQPTAAAEDRQQAEETPQPAAAVLITGGLGALGLALAESLVERGETRIALLARRPPNPAQAAVIERLQARAHVVFAQGDVSDSDSLRQALDPIKAALGPISQVYHAAGVLEDGLLFDMSAQRWRTPLLPKVQGTWNLHQATLDQPVQRFVLFSSIAALLGSPGQGNYAAANAFLDAFAAHRHLQGLPATSINWGPWADAGMAAGTVAAALQARGLGMLPTAAALELLHRLADAAGGSRAVMDVDWSVMLRGPAVPRPFLAALVSQEAPEEAAQAQAGVDHAFCEQLAGATPEQREEALRQYFIDELARIMGWEAAQLNPLQPLSELGMDSLMAMELKNNLERRLAITLPMAAFIEAPSIASLARHAVAEFTGRAAGSPAAIAPDQVLVPLKASGTKPPWFCVHPLGGNAGCYGDLAKQVEPDQPLLALWGRGADGVGQPPASLDAMIDEYLAAIKEAQPEGPYHLVGWSAGGIYAYEIARRLRSDGDEVALLALLDTPLPTVYDNIDLNDDARFLSDFASFSNIFLGSAMQLSEEQLRSLDRQDALQLLLDEAKREGLLVKNASLPYIERLVEASRAHVSFIKTYELQHFEQEIQLFRPETTGVLESLSGKSWGADLGWSQQVPAALLSVHTTPGDHFTMLLGDCAAELAKKLSQRCQDRLDEQPLLR